MIKMKHFTYYYFSLLFLVIFQFQVFSQDEYLTQFYQNEGLINPSMTGGSNGQLHLRANTKQQWNSIAKPYKTSVFIIDKSTMANDNLSIGIGLILMADKAGNSNLKTKNVAANISVKIKTSVKNMLAAGVQVGWVQKNISLDGLSWDAQYNGKFYDASLSTNEMSNTAPLNSIRLAGGLSYITNINRYNKFKLGVSGYHLTQNINSFYGNNADKLYSRYNLFASGELVIENTNTSFLPSLLLQIQGPNLMLVGGILISYRIGLDSRNTRINKSSAFMWGVHYRVGDAIIPSVHYEYRRKFKFGLSYDINLSKLTAASYVRGGFELSLNYFFGGGR
jgi:type IX secretion system PorP/SprF family membrane protein